ncbi:hypothetical protein NKJ53_29435, partial [Mesorhizobium sp. M0090]|uniref:hypothetical protein n=1 Tax=Mesorhizobium sp. M0090 TaxID=2956874 RepID=UPI00333C3A49
KTVHRHTVKALQPRVGMFLPVSWHLTLLAILARLGAVHPGVGGAFLIFLRHGHLHHPPGIQQPCVPQLLFAFS